MLREADLSDIKRYGETFYQLGLNPLTSGYPAYFDGTKTKDDFEKVLMRRLENENSRLVIAEFKGQVEGIVGYFYLPDDRYLQVDLLNLSYHADIHLTELVEHLESHFKDFQILFGIDARNATYQSVLKDMGWIAEAPQVINLLEEPFIRCEPRAVKSNIIRVSHSNQLQFQSLFPQDNPDNVYWTPERLIEELDHWVIYLFADKGAIWARPFGDRQMEIYGYVIAEKMANDSQNILRELLYTLIEGARQSGIRQILFFSDEKEYELLRSLGFKERGTYLCYSKTL
ncbi:hypothetical protein [Streptococcus sp. S784/96/1]|uniref:hypothetical protein n=1 Tax=Streptococcus sp. S784/96/1 TaxID=2653499 RepID=UPI0013869485|nr:hypothetical protein [Streptococcus sp. S784/96/1]